MPAKPHDDLDLPEEEIPEGENRFSFSSLQWTHGDKTLRNTADWRYLGGFFSEEKFPGSAPCNLTTKSKLIPGYHSADLRLCIVRTRVCWYVEDARLRVHRAPSYDAVKDMNLGKPRSHLQALVRIYGDAPEADPWLFTLKGLVSNAFLPGWGGAQEDRGIPALVEERLIQPAHEAYGRRLPLSCWWLRIGPEQAAEGTLIARKVGEGRNCSWIVRPTLYGPSQKVSDFKTYYIGKEMMDSNRKVWNQYDGWAKEWSQS